MHVALEWNDEALEHITRHHVTPAEVEDVTYDVRSQIRKAGQDRYILHGRTTSGRYLKVVIERIGRGRFYPVTAYEMDDTDRRLYQRRLKR